MNATHTHVFKTVPDCQIKADVHGASPGAPRPVVIWLHGGALVEGSRTGIDATLRDLMVAAGMIVVAVDYRLAPETKLPQIVEDVRDAHDWIRRDGAALFTADADRIAVIGDSAGGYLALVAGCRHGLAPRPRAVVSLYGYGDIAGDWYAKPDPFYCRQPPVDPDQARAVVGTTELSETPPAHQRSLLYLYCRQHGLWPTEIAGLDPQALGPWCPVQNVDGDYPPTLLLHGDRDTDVPYRQSVLMADALARAGVRHELVTLEGAGHCFAGAAEGDVARAHRRVVSFLADALAVETTE